MARYGMLINTKKCIGCYACRVACQRQNDLLPTEDFIRYEEREIGAYPNVRVETVPLQCMHCEDAPCVKVCPTGASQKMADGTVQIDKSKCIGCQFCAMACPYGVRYLNQEERVVEKCTLCEQRISQGELPQCVAQCGARARFFGDLEQGVDGFEAPAHPSELSCGYDDMQATRVTLKDYVEPYTENDIHHLADAGNEPKLMYLMREGRKWRE